jgi:GDPmannose 4,6-dehydratase
LFVQQRYFRSTEFEFVVGDSVKASREVGRKPRVSFEGLVRRMIDYDLRLGKRERMVTAGDEIIQRGLWHG